MMSPEKAPEAMPEKRPVFFFDIDNCVGNKVLDIMSDLISQFIQTHLSLSPADAESLHQRYYIDYGLAIEGLVRHHKVDPLEYNAKVDEAIPLEDIISKPDLQLRHFLLHRLDRTKVRPWLLTNAYVHHARRVIRLLGVEDLFDGLTYCDYAAERMICKPFPAMYEKAMREAGVEDVGECYFVDDSYINARGAHDFGWTTVHLIEPDEQLPAQPACKYQIRKLDELAQLFPRFFKAEETETEAEAESA